MSSPEHGTPRFPRARRLLIGGLGLAIGGLLAAPAAATAAPATPAATAKATSAAAAPVLAAAKTPRTLRNGSRGADVKALQQKLKKLHYDIGAADGVFGSDTLHAVTAFQKVHGLGRDGIAGQATRKKLAKPSTPRPRSPRAGRYVEVNLAKQVAYFFSGRNVSAIVDISSGNNKRYTYTPTQGPNKGKKLSAVARTPRGKFKIQRKISTWRNSSSGLGKMWKPSYFTGGYALHGAMSVPPYPASHGCIRMPMKSTDRLFSALFVGRPVYLFG